MAHEDVERPTALVTGASSGIGRAVALELGARGYRVALGYRSNRRGAEKCAAELPPQACALLVRLDLARPEEAARVVSGTAEELGGLDLLVNNAGVNRRAAAVEEEPEQWNRVIDVDLTGPFLCARAAARHMVERGRGGRIVNVTSVHEHVPILGGSAYCAAKAGLGAVTKVMALELAEHGISVNSVAPGETATPMNGVGEGTDARGIGRPAIPAGRPARPEEVAEAVAYLASGGAAYTTGVSLVVDGGLSLMSAIPNQEHTRVR